MMPRKTFFATMNQMPFSLRPIRFPRLAILALLLCGEALAFTALQFDATASRNVSRTDGDVTAWVSTRQGVIANPCHASEGGWTSPQYDRDGSIDFFSATGVASPLSFPQSESGLVSRVFIVADGFDAATYRTLLDAPCPLRLMSADGDGAGHFATSSVLSSIDLSIDYAQATVYSPGLHLYEIVLTDPCPLNDLYLGGSPATPAWKRSWNGSVREVIFAAPSMSATEASVIRSYLSKRWETGRYRSGESDELSTLRALGIRTGGVYGSMLIMR